MIREILANMNLANLSFSLLVCFLIAFVLMCVWVFRQSAKEKYDYIQSLPLAVEE